jgi:hypothetical protein
MPKLKTDFATTPISFYKFICKNEEITSSYVGHTINFRCRKSKHKSCCNNENSKAHHFKIYQTIRANGGWDNWNMVEISSQLCSNERDAERVEQNLIGELKSDMNSRRAFSTDEEIAEYQKQYQRDNKDAILAYQRQQYQKQKEIVEYTKNYDAQQKYNAQQRETPTQMKEKCLAIFTERQTINALDDGINCLVE